MSARQSNILNFINTINANTKQEYTTIRPGDYAKVLNLQGTNSKDKYLKAFQQVSSLRKTLLASASLYAQNPEYKVDFITDIKNTHFTTLKAKAKPFVQTFKEYRSHNAVGTANFGSIINFPIDTSNTHLLGDGCIIFTLTGLKALNATNKCKYADKLGERIIGNIEIRDGSSMQSLRAMGMEIFANKILSPDKKIAWDRSITDNHMYMGSLTEYPGSSVDEIEQMITVNTGANIYKNEHDSVTVCVPLIFFFNNDETPLPVKDIPHKLEVVVTLASANECRRVIRWDDTDDSFPTNQSDYLVEPTITAVLHMAHIVTNNLVYDAIYSTTDSQLIRYYTHKTYITTTTNGSVALSGISGMIERLFVALRPQSNTLSTSEASYTNWYKGSSMTTSTIETPALTDSVTTSFIIYDKETSLINTHKLMYKGADLSNEIPIKMEDYKALMQHAASHVTDSKNIIEYDFRYGQDSSNTFQPTGAIYLPTGNELSFNYTSTLITPSNPVIVDVMTVNLGYLIYDKLNGFSIKTFM